MASSIQLSPESLCDGLDQLSINRLELMDQLIKSNMMLECCMRSGFFLLGKTRYALGNRAVSSLQLPNAERKLNALATAVSTPVPVEGYIGDILYQQIDTKFQDPIISVYEDETSEEVLADTDDHSEGLRKRYTSIEDEKAEEESFEGDEHNYSGNHKVKTINRDPIRWFSALPPQTLRQAQSDFKSALQLSAQCASIQLKLRSVNKEYKRLRNIKAQIEQLEKEP